MSSGFSFWSSLRCGHGHMCQGYEERPPFVWEDGSANAKGKSVDEALRVLNLMLQLDSFGEGQRVDLAYIREVLKSLQDGSKMDKEERDVTAIINNAELDCSTQAFLLAFSSRVERKHKLKDVVNAVRMGIRMKHKMKHNGLTAKVAQYTVPGLEHIRGLDTWNNFDVFQVDRDTGGKPLLPIGWAVLERRNLTRAFSISKPRLHAFLVEIEKAYLTPHYHNAIHAADVTQSVHVLLRQGLDRGLSDLEVLAVVFGATCHDVAHPGVTNDFRVKSGDEDAITYNDLSVNENMHLATTFRILNRAECNFVRDTFSPKQRESLRKMVVETVLGTDMAKHFSNLNVLKAIMEEKGKDISKWESTVPIMEAVLHCADLSNTCKPYNIARKWTDRVLDEFFAQGDQERVLGRELSPLCDRHSVSLAGSQVGFINFIVKPMFQALTPFCDTSDMLNNMKKYHEFWSEELSREKKPRKSTMARAELRSLRAVSMHH